MRIMRCKKKKKSKVKCYHTSQKRKMCNKKNVVNIIIKSPERKKFLKTDNKKYILNK